MGPRSNGTFRTPSSGLASCNWAYESERIAVTTISAGAVVGQQLLQQGKQGLGFVLSFDVEQFFALVDRDD